MGRRKVCGFFREMRVSGSWIWEVVDALAVRVRLPSCLVEVWKRVVDRLSASTARPAAHVDVGHEAAPPATRSAGAFCHHAHPDVLRALFADVARRYCLGMNLRLLLAVPAAAAVLALPACSDGGSPPASGTSSPAGGGSEGVPTSEDEEVEGGEATEGESPIPTPANPVSIAKKVEGADCGDAKSGSTDIDGNRYVSCILNDQEMSVTTYVGDPQQLGVVEPSDDTTTTIYGDDFVLYMWNGDVSAETVAEQVGGKIEPALP